MNESSPSRASTVGTTGLEEGKIERFHVITGGPGSGKSTLVAALAAQGLGHCVEAGRAVIKTQVASRGSALPWADREAFAGAMQAFDLASYRAAQARRGDIVFDRGLPDLVGYRRLSGLAVPADLDCACRDLRYASRVFAAPPWPAIYAQDSERRQSLEEAEATFRAVSAAYTAYGYELINLPLSPVVARAAFVRDAIGANGDVECT